MPTQKVSVRGRSYTVDVTQTSRTVWIAAGKVGPIVGNPPEDSREIKGKGTSEMSAIADWIHNANYWTN